MRRSDRLFDLMQLLRGGRLRTAAELAARTGVSTRTIWRDMETLAASGVPVEGTRGAGYRLAERVALPPLALTGTEMEALRLGLSVVAEAADPELQAAARALSARIDATLPGPRAAPAASGWGPAAFPLAEAARGFPFMPLLRAAIRERRRLRMDYASPEDGTGGIRVIRPLQMEYLGRLWSLTAWCELHDDFRVFRVDRITALEDTGEVFGDEPGKRLADYLARFAGGPDGN